MQFDKTQNLLNRMKRAYWKKKGIRISAEELQELSITFLGQMWEDEDPHHLSTDPADGYCQCGFRKETEYYIPGTCLQCGKPIRR